MGIAQAALTGLGAQFLWPQWTWWNSVSPLVGIAAAASFAVLFARNFLSSPVRSGCAGWTANALLIGSALEMVLLSFALADRINVARRFKEQAQARIAAEHAMEPFYLSREQYLRPRS